MLTNKNILGYAGVLSEVVGGLRPVRIAVFFVSTAFNGGVEIGYKIAARQNPNAATNYAESAPATPYLGWSLKLIGGYHA